MFPTQFNDGSSLSGILNLILLVLIKTSHNLICHYTLSLGHFVVAKHHLLTLKLW